jgi:hypothetical protein
MHLSSPGSQSRITTLALTLMLAALWLLLRGYHGLTGDGQIYAFQALSRILPQLRADLYLQNTSQDQFTIFSPFYARFIGLMGLENAARLLTIVFTVWFLAAAWSFARSVTGREGAWLAAALLLIVAGDYGGSGVFRFSEPFLTARLPAEALVVTALALHFRGMKRTGLVLAVGTLFIHPLIALPGLLLLICVRLPARVSVVSATAGVLIMLGIAIAAAMLPVPSHLLAIMDTAWLEVVRERSQFLFLPLWSFHDWDINTRPFIYLGFTAIAVPDEKIRKLCMAAALVGAAGLAVALIGSLIGPVAILVQGQAWRWVWVTVFVSVLVLPITVLRIYQDPRCGPLCAILLVSGYTLSAVDGTACVSFALVFWLTRTYIDARGARYFRRLSVALGIALTVWILIKSSAIMAPPISSSAGKTLGSERIGDISGLPLSAAVLAAAAWWWIRSSRTPRVPLFLSAMFAAFSYFIFPTAFEQSHTFGSQSNSGEFADWISAIPPISTVLVAPAQDVGAFVWFTLKRPNYLALDQSAGVVFSRATALEVQRRSQILLPLADPDWKILTSLRTAASTAGPRRLDSAVHPVTAKSLTEVCADRELGFVISPEHVGFHSLRHDHAGKWKDWSLYDCRNVRSSAPET